MKNTDSFTLTNGVTIPAIGFGTWQTPPGEVTYIAVGEALRAGYRHIDTAQAYGNEASVGKAILDSGIPRSEIFVTSKLPAEIKNYEQAVRRMQLYWGVYAMPGETEDSTRHMITNSMKIILRRKLIKKGELAVFTAGDPATNMVSGRGRSTNVMQVVEAK